MNTFPCHTVSYTCVCLKYGRPHTTHTHTTHTHAITEMRLLHLRVTCCILQIVGHCVVNPWFMAIFSTTCSLFNIACVVHPGPTQIQAPYTANLWRTGNRRTWSWLLKPWISFDYYCIWSDDISTILTWISTSKQRFNKVKKGMILKTGDMWFNKFKTSPLIEAMCGWQRQK